MTQGCQALGEPHTITAADGNLDPRDRRPPLGRGARKSAHRSQRNPALRADAGTCSPASASSASAAARTTSCASSRSPNGDRPALAVAEPVRAGQTIRFTLRDAIGARDDMKAMLDEQADVAPERRRALRRLLQLRRARQHALRSGRPRPRADSAAASAHLPVVGIESTFEIAPPAGAPACTCSRACCCSLAS